MQYKKIVNIFSCILTVVTAGCNNGNMSSEKIGANLTTKKLQSIQSSVQQVNNLYSLEYTIPTVLDKVPQKTALCSIGNEVCAQLSSVPFASYVLGEDRSYHWVEQDYPTILQLTFNKSLPNDFHLASIYNDLSQSQGEVAGHLTEVDDSSCKKLAVSGISPGSTCTINLAYTGDTMEQIVNNIHMEFKSSNKTLLDYTFSVHNIYLTNLNTPALSVANQANDIGVVVSNPDTSSGTLDYIHEFSNAVQLINFGTAPIQERTGTPSIIVRTGKSFDYDLTNLYYLNGLQTTCSDVGLSVGDNCLFGFSFIPNLINNSIQSELGRLIFTYDDGDQPINMTSRFVLSSGDFSYDNYYITDWVHNQIVINKRNSGNNYVSYSVQLSNIKFSLDYDPKFDIGIFRDLNTNKLLYSYGDYSTNLSINDLIGKITFGYESDCFNGFDFSQNNDLDGRSCTIKVNYNGDPKVFSEKPLSALLIASYYSPIEDRNVDQIIGVLTLGYGLQSPNGSYLNNCDNSSINYVNGILSAICHRAQGQTDKYTLSYDELCAPGSTVSLKLINPDSKWAIPNGALVCDSYANSKFLTSKDILITNATKELDNHFVSQTGNNDLVYDYTITAINVNSGNIYTTNILSYENQKVTVSYNNGGISAAIASGIDFNSGLSNLSNLMWDGDAHKISLVNNLGVSTLYESACNDGSGITKFPYYSDLGINGVVACTSPKNNIVGSFKDKGDFEYRCAQLSQDVSSDVKAQVICAADDPSHPGFLWNMRSSQNLGCPINKFLVGCSIEHQTGKVTCSCIGGKS